MSKSLRAALAALAIPCALSAARADTQAVSFGAAWAKVAAAGQTVEVQAVGGITLTTAVAAPATGSPGFALTPGERICRTLAADLYARSGTATVTTGVSCGGTGTAGTPSVTSDPQNAAIQGAVAMTVGSSYAAQRPIGETCTAAGTASLTLADGSALTIALGVGYQQQGFAVTQVTASTANCTFYNLK